MVISTCLSDVSIVHWFISSLQSRARWRAVVLFDARSSESFRRRLEQRLGGLGRPKHLCGRF